MDADHYDLSGLVERLEGMADEGYRELSRTVVPGVNAPVLGVRVPRLRALAREILRGDWRGFLEGSRGGSLLELSMLHAIVLGGARCDFSERQALLTAFLPHVDNWDVCDTLCASYKPAAAEREALFDYLVECAASGHTYTKRFGLVMMMSRYRDEAHLDRVLNVYRRFSHPDYYARMAAAWGLATLYLSRPEDVLSILQSGALDAFTRGKALQKLRESYRVSDEDKAMLKSLRTQNEAACEHE